MDSDINQLDFLWQVAEPEIVDLQIQPFLHDLLRELKLHAIELSILITDDEHIRHLNRTYRSKNHTTDVLSFPQDGTSAPGSLRHLGDIAISYYQAQKQAQQIGQSLGKEIRFLILHGTLHLIGYDHETDQGQMIQRQTELKQELASYF